MTEFVKYPSAPVAADGWPILGVAFLVTAVLWAGYFMTSSDQVGWPRSALAIAGSLAALFLVFSIWFFRNPERSPASKEPSAVISAADGTVLKVERVNDPRYGEPSEKISIFMSPLNVHVNRAPVAGTVEKVEYVPGKFFAANLDKASTDNERNLVIIKTDQGQRVAFLQIAGFIARRIVSHLKPGDKIGIGQRYGMIRFGSRMEMFLPAGSQILVRPGQAIQSGETVVGMMPKAGGRG